MPALKPASPEHWSEYWSSGQVTSLPDDFAGNYDGEIAAFWAEQFAGVPAGGQIVDLCTGNGAVALLAASHARTSGRPVRITAVDAARISPEALARRHPGLAELVPAVEFVGGVLVEDLDLRAGEADLVTSQYGIEYCDWAPAAATVARLLKPGGRFAMVCHAASSELVTTMEAEARDYARLSELGLQRGLRRFLAGTLSFARLKKLLQAVRAELVPAWRLSGSPLLAFVLKACDGLLASSEADLRARRLQLAGFVRQLELGEARLADMLRVNQAIHAAPGWQRVFEAAGLEALDSREILYRGRHRSGQAYRFGKPR